MSRFKPENRSFRKEWMKIPKFSSWLQQSKRDEKAAWCRLCNAPINKPKLSHLEAHMKTVKHQANMGAIKSVKPFSQEFKKKRFEVSFVVVLNVKKT